MLSVRTKVYLKKRAKKEIKHIIKKYKNILQKYYNIAEQYGYKIRFTNCGFTKVDKFKYRLDANAAIFSQSTINVSPEWMYQLIFNNSKEVDNAFILTLGHEMTHKDENDLCPFTFCIKKSKFLAYVNEVHADFGGSQKLADSSRERLIQASLYKKNSSHQNKGDCTHPSWDKRIEYATNYNFNEDLVRKIASDINYTNEEIIRDVSKHFENIILK